MQKYLDEHKAKDYSPASIRKAVIAIRSRKLPDPKQIPNVGSFFKNPIVSRTVLDSIKKQFSGLPSFPAAHDQIKLPAGWLIEHANLTGKQFKNVGLHKKNALVLVKTGNASFEDLLALKEMIIERVQSKFGITLEQEPETIDRSAAETGGKNP